MLTMAIILAATLPGALGSIDAGSRLAARGTVDVVDCSSGRLETIGALDGDFWATWTHTGTRRSNPPGGPFDRMTGRAVGILWVKAGVPHGHGAHEYVDVDGDKVFIESERIGATSTWRFTSGTGKYAGITGQGEYSDLAYFPRLSADTYQFCPVSKGVYEIKRAAPAQ